MFILQVFYPPSVVTIAVGMICCVMDFMLVMMHFNVTIMISWYNPCMMNDKHAKTGKKTADYRPGGGGGGTLGISGWGCAVATLKPLTYTIASSAEFCYPILE